VASSAPAASERDNSSAWNTTSRLESLSHHSGQRVTTRRSLVNVDIDILQLFSATVLPTTLFQVTFPAF